MRPEGRGSRSRRVPGVLARFAIAGARGDGAAVRDAARAARALRIPRRALEETGLMLMLYAGYPAALETLRALNEAWPGRARTTREGTVAGWRRRGAALCRRVYGPAYPRLLAGVRALHPDLMTWMVEQGYGRVLARPGLGVPVRELVTVAVLAAMGWERQLVSHLVGARRVGAGVAGLRGMLSLAAGLGARRARVRRAWRRAGVDRVRSQP